MLNLMHIRQRVRLWAVHLSRYAVFNYPSDYLLRSILLSTRRIRVRFRCAARICKRGAVGDWSFCVPVWLAWQPGGPGRAVLRLDGVEHHAPGTQMSATPGEAQ